MKRAFDEHRRRRVESLDGAWRFVTDPDGSGEERGFQNGLSDSIHMTVPSVWNTTRGLLGYEGAAWYERKFYTEGGTLRFVFGAVMTCAKVFLDGEVIGSHYGGFSQFDIIIPNVAIGEHRLTVRVSNSFDAHSIPQTMVDWYHYGGITRSVTVETLRGVCILSSRFEYTLSDDLGCAVCKPILEIYNAEGRVKKTGVRLSLDGKKYTECEAEVGGRKRLSVELPEFTVSDVRLWDVGKAELYTVSVETDTDDLIDRVGFRKVEVRDKKFLLNGRAVEIMGVNRHEENTDFGFAFPEGLMKRDIDLMLEAGCNAVRGSHYPNSRYFVDLLDECGVLFWSEIPIWGVGFSDKALADKTVVKRGLTMHREMTEQYYNHPSVVIWGMHNEINSYTKAAYNMSKLYYEFLKDRGGNRAVVYASCYPSRDICFEFCDMVALNKYIGWYDRGDSWAEYLKDTKARLASLGFRDKPIIMGEFGGAAIAGFHDESSVVWSEEYQAKIITEALETFIADSDVIGYYVWQFSDIRTHIELSMNRARSFNNKGILNEYRKPKLAYYAVQRIYKSRKN